MQTVAVECPQCGRIRDVSARTARRGAGRCRFCLSPHTIPPVDDSARRYWLKRFSDSELASIASGIWGHTISPDAIHSRRATLLASAHFDEDDV